MGWLDLNWKILTVCVILLAVFCAMTMLVENRHAKIRRRARRIFGKVRLREEARSVDDTARFNYRRTRWGMTPAMVKAAETGISLKHESPTCLSYHGQVYKTPCGIDYLFEQGRLTEVRGALRIEFPQTVTYINFFNRLVKRFSRSYGLPVSWDVFWADGAPSGAAFDGTALAQDWAWCCTRWSTARSCLWLSLKNVDGRISISFCCRSKDQGACA